jgi:hypothetical protein
MLLCQLLVLLTGGVDFTQNSLHWMVVIMILWMPLKKWGLPLSPMVIYCRRLLILLLLHCLFFVILRAAENEKKEVITAAATL